MSKIRSGYRDHVIRNAPAKIMQKIKGRCKRRKLIEEENKKAVLPDWTSRIDGTHVGTAWEDGKWGESAGIKKTSNGKDLYQTL